MESEITISKGRESYSFIVRYEYYYQKEQWYDVHGDPGTPEIEEVELISIHTNEDLLLLMDNFKNWGESSLNLSSASIWICGISISLDMNM